MERYANRGGKSAVHAFEIGAQSVKVRFDDGRTYLYTVDSAGTANIEEMKRLARAGQGLNGFISRVVRKMYASKS